jgi:hypothetical protein
LEVREVTVEDPTLSADARRRLTEELREIIGAERVCVPPDRPHPSRGEHPPPARPVAVLAEHRLFLAITFLAFLTIGAIVSLITGDWWLLAVAAGVHAIGTMTVILLTLRMTMITERPSPTAVALLEEEGIRDPEGYFAELVHEFTEDDDRQGPADVSSADAQAVANTPTGGPMRQAGDRDLPALINWATIIGLVALSLIVPAASGDRWLWLMAAVAVPSAAGWVLLQKVVGTIDLSHELRAHERRFVAEVVFGTALAVAAFCVLIVLWLSR